MDGQPQDQQMARKRRAALLRYVESGKDKVRGWFSRIDAEIFRALLIWQDENNLRGAGAEIGVHHGMAFIALCLAMRPDEKCYCIDVFDDQELNIDKSGRGDRRQFESNLAEHGIDGRSVVIRQSSSMEVRASDIVEAAGAVRFFSVDGGHWREIVENDLVLAEASLAPHGVIAMDDFHRRDWPDVSAGYFSWYSNRKKPIVPLAIGFNKLYLCDESYAMLYREVLAKDEWLCKFLIKTVTFQGVNVPVFNWTLVPEVSIKRRIMINLMIFAPDLFVWLRRHGRGARTGNT